MNHRAAAPDTEAIRNAVLEALRQVAPESDPSTLAPSDDIREALDIDSMDFLNFAIALDKRLHVAVPEMDYRKLQTVEGAVRYLADRLQSAGVGHA